MPDTEGRQTGKIKWYNQKDCYGFILPDAGGKDVFIHKNRVDASAIDQNDLTEGRQVSYVLKEFKGRLQAEDIQVH